MKPAVGMKVTCCHDGEERTAFIAGVYPDDTFDLAVMKPTGNEGGGWMIIGGLVKPTLAVTPEDRKVDGHYWQS